MADKRQKPRTCVYHKERESNVHIHAICTHSSATGSCIAMVGCITFSHCEYSRFCCSTCSAFPKSSQCVCTWGFAMSSVVIYFTTSAIQRCVDFGLPAMNPIALKLVSWGIRRKPTVRGILRLRSLCSRFASIEEVVANKRIPIINKVWANGYLQ